MKFEKISKIFKSVNNFIASIVNFILLFPVYFIGIGVTSVIARIVNKKFLDLKKDNKESYWEGKEVSNRFLLLEFWDFLRIRKKWWLLPIIIMLLIIGVLIIFGQGLAVSPFIYVLA